MPSDDQSVHSRVTTHSADGFITEVPGSGTNTSSNLGAEFGDSKIDLRLPNGYNVVAVRETLLSEASFVSRTSRGFWRRMMDNEQFVSMFSAGFHHIITCVSETGLVLVDKLTNATSDNPFIAIMASTLTDMYYRFQRGERDVFLPRLPELLCFMIVNALQAAAPKHQRIYNSIRFRELIIDWTTELVGGIRTINCRTGKEWFFSDAQDLPIMTASAGTSSNPNLLALTQTLDRRKATSLPLNSVGSRYHLDHSPLVAMHIEKYNPSLSAATAKNVVRVTLSHAPDRPLISLQSGLDKITKFRELKCDSEEVKVQRKEAQLKRTQIMREYAEQKTQLNDDVNKLREGMRASIAMLSGKRVSNKALLEAAVVKAGK